MGLDLVELQMDLEDEFEIEIPDERASTLTTIGQTIDFVVAELRKRDRTPGACATMRSFNRLRKGLVSNCGVRRSDVRLDAPIGQLVSANYRRLWKQLATDAGLRTERLRLFRRNFPPAEMSIRELVQSRCKKRYVTIDGAIDADVVAERVMQMVSGFAGLPAAQLNRQMDYVRDLHLG